ncbi:MAG TPA: putative Ig domain-containing protein [Burkholderiales bacterium]|nr:putative Ig domain-containing protein [Burkholderiales bacterium]
MATEYVTGTDANDWLDGGEGENEYQGGQGDDWINGATGENTIVYNLGDGIDTISYAPPRSYQFAGWLEEIERALASDDFSSATYGNTYFGSLDSSLLQRLPSGTSMANVLQALSTPLWDDDAGTLTPGTVDGAAARSAFQELLDWINTPVTNVVKFGPGISLADLSVQTSPDSSFGAPAIFAIAIGGGDQGVVFNMVPPDLAAASSMPSEPPPMDITFEFVDENGQVTTATLAEILAQSDGGVAGFNNGTDAADVINGSLADDQIYGYGGDDLIDGGAGMDFIYGGNGFGFGSGNDVIAGGAGSDIISGEDGDDIIAAGRDGGSVGGGAGNDVYLFNLGDGALFVDNTPGIEGGETDTLSFGKDVAPENVIAYVDEFGTLTLAVQGTSDQVLINWFMWDWGTSQWVVREDQVVPRVQFIDASGEARVYDLTALVTSNQTQLLGATVDSPVFLFGGIDGSQYDLTGTVPVAGGDYATRYAITGDMFNDPPAGNQAPQVGTTIADVSAVEGQPLTIALPQGAFTDADGDSLTYSAALDSGAGLVGLPTWLQFNSAMGTFTGTPDDAEVAAGALRVVVTASDGQASASQTFGLTFVAVNDAPQAAAPNVFADAIEDAAFSLALPAGSFLDVDSALTVSADPADMPAWLTFDAATMTFRGTPANGDVGSVSITVTATDGQYSAFTEVTIGVANVNDDPTVINPMDDVSVTEDSDVAIDVSSVFGDVDLGDILSVSADTPAWLTYTNGELWGTPGNGDVGTHSVTLTATDLAGGTVQHTFSVTVENVNDAPSVVNSVGDRSVNEDSAIAVDVGNVFGDIDLGDSLSVSVSAPSWLTYSNGVLSGTPGNAEVGTHVVTLTATDVAGESVQEAFSITVLNLNDAPTVQNEIGNWVIDEDSAFSMTIPADVFADVDAGDSLTVSLTGVPAWLTYDPATRVLSGMPGNADVGSYTLTLVADDGEATAEESFSITVANTNDAPTREVEMADQVADEGSPVNFSLPAGMFADVDGDVLTLTASMADGTELPSWLSFDAANGTFSGTPGWDDAGTLSITVTASDGSASASDTFDLRVADVNTAPTVANPIAPQTATEDSEFSFTVPDDTFADAQGDSLVLTATLADGSPLPAWLSFHSPFAGTPSDGDVGTITIVVSATDSAGLTVSTSFNLSVANVNDAPAGSPTINGTANEGQTLTADASGISDADGLGTFSYQWLRDGSVISGATGSGYVLGDADVGGQMSVRVSYTDGYGTAESLTSASTGPVVGTEEPAPDPEPVPEPVPGQTLIGGSGNNTLTGGDGDDVLDGRGGRDVLNGLGGDDTFRFYRDGTASRGASRRHNGSPGVSGTGETVSINGKRVSYDTFNGGDGYDTLLGTSGADAILLDVDRSRRLSGIEMIDAGDGDDVVDLTSRRFDYGDVTIEGGSGNDTLWSSSGDDLLYGESGNDNLHGGAGDDYLYGGSGRDELRGGRGLDLLQGGSGDDELRDGGRGMLHGGSGNDLLVGGSGNTLFVGGSGNDRIRLGGGNDVILYNSGDGRDVVESSGGSATLSLGGRIRISDLKFRRSGQDLILETGNNESITFDDWYRGRQYRAVDTLQLITSGGMSGGSSEMRDDTVEMFDFGDLVARYDRARRSNPGLSRWALTNGLMSFQLDASSDEAMGGDLAHQYGMTGSLAGITVSAAQDVIGSSDFGSDTQRLRTLNLHEEGLVKLS